MGLGEFGCHFRVTDGWTVHVRERRRHVGRLVWNVRVPAKQSTGREGRGTEGKITKARRKGTACDTLATGPATHSNRKQNVPEVAKKLGFQFESRGFENR